MPVATGARTIIGVGANSRPRHPCRPRCARRRRIGGTAPILSISASPTSGKHPLAVKFTLTTTIPAQLVSWEVIFGDGSRATAQGAPPASVTHTYAKAETYAAYLVLAQQQ